MSVQLLRTQETEQITHWADLWLSDSKQAGYVNVSNFEDVNDWHGLYNKNRLIHKYKGKPQHYISLNAFADFRRKSSKEHLKQIRNIGIDVDQYELDLTIPEALDMINDLIRDEKIPIPNLVLMSRGIQLIYSIKDGASPNMSWLSRYITEQFIAKLDKVGADWGAKDVSRMMRVPESVNERNGATVHPEIWHDTPYTLQELQAYCKPLERFKNSYKRKFKLTYTIYKPDSNLLVYYRVNHARISDLERLIELRKGNFTHKRNNLLYIYTYHRALTFDSLKDTKRAVEQQFEAVHSTADKELSRNEFNHTVKSAYKDAREFFEWYKGKGYKMSYELNDGIIKPYKTSNIIDMLDITTDEQKHLKTLINDDVRAERERQRVNKYNRKKGIKPMSEYNQARKNAQAERAGKLAVLMADNPDMTRKELANELGVNRKTVTRLIKSYNL